MSLGSEHFREGKNRSTHFRSGTKSWKTKGSFLIQYFHCTPLVCNIIFSLFFLLRGGHFSLHFLSDFWYKYSENSWGFGDKNILSGSCIQTNIGGHLRSVENTFLEICTVRVYDVSQFRACRFVSFKGNETVRFSFNRDFFDLWSCRFFRTSQKNCCDSNNNFRRRMVVVWFSSNAHKLALVMTEKKINILNFHDNFFSRNDIWIFTPKIKVLFAVDFFKILFFQKIAFFQEFWIFTPKI